MTTAISNSVNLPSVNSGNGTLTDEFLNGLVQGGAWQFGAGPRILTYSFNNNFDLDAFGNVIPGSGGNWTASLIDAVNRALAEWSNVANISFQNIASGNYYFESYADIALTLTGAELRSDPEFPAIGVGIFPDTALGALVRADHAAFGIDYPNPEGDVFLDNYYPGYSVLYPGGFGIEAILHELGHALGLKHPDDDGGNGRPTFEALGIGQYDSERWTIMTGNTTEVNDFSGHLASPMPLDILAIQRIYGANTTFHVGNDTYLLPDHFLSVHEMRWTIWDAGGVDTIEGPSYPYSFAFGLNIDLRPGEVTKEKSPAVIPGWEMYIAFGADIENAKGGAGGDTIIGNDLNNVLTGNDGFDSLFGGDGIDVIDGGNGGGVLDGGAGADTMLGGNGSDKYIVDNPGDIVEDPSNGGRDMVSSSVTYVLPAGVENLELTGDADISGTGNSLANEVSGNAKANRLDGVGGLDKLSGGAGNDVYVIGETIAPTSVVLLASPAPLSPLPSNAILLDATLPGAAIVYGAYDDEFDADDLVDYVFISFLTGPNNVVTHSVIFETFSSSNQPLLTGHYDFSNFGSVGVIYDQVQILSLGATSFDIFEAQFDYSGVTPEVTKFHATFRIPMDTAGIHHILGEVNINHAGGATSVVVERPNSGIDHVESAVTYALTANVEDLTLTGLGAISGVGNELENAITGNFGNNRLEGEGGDDLLAGGAGNDYLLGDAGNDNLNGDSGDDTLVGGVAADTLRGGVGFDSLVGGDGVDTADYSVATGGVFAELWRRMASNDGQGASDTILDIEGFVGSAFGDVLAGDDDDNVFRGGAGADALYGGGGVDTADYSAAPGGIFVELWRFFASNDGEGSGDTLVDIEKLVGTAFDDVLAGDNKSNTFTPGSGRDAVYGGGGVDTADYSDASRGVLVELWRFAASNDGQDSVDTLVDIENLIGSPFDDTLAGDNNNNTFKGGAGVDGLYGGGGNDSVDYGDAVFGVVADLAAFFASSDGQGGADTLVNIENITGSSFDDIISGDLLANRLISSGGDDTLRGGGGNDTLDGGVGDDTADYSNAAGGVFVELWRFLSINDGQGGVDTLADVENVVGSNGNDTLAGDGSNNEFRGGAGIDALFGGGGIDTANYSFATAGVRVELWRFVASDDGQGGADVLVDIENLVGSSFDDVLAGDNNNNVFKGTAGVDALYGGGGMDTIDYSDAISAVSVDLQDFFAHDNGRGGSDTLVEIENIIGSNYDDTLIGDGAANLFKGGAGFDHLFGFEGTDTVDYSDATTAIEINLLFQAASRDGLGASDQLVDIENVTGSSFADRIWGDGSNNLLDGGSGDDVLRGFGGNDTLNGGDGIDSADYSGFFVNEGVTVELWRSFASNDGNSGSDILIDIEDITGSSFNDILAGDNANNTFIAGGGVDAVFGGGGIDTIDYGAATGGVFVELWRYFASNDGMEGSDTLIDIENIRGSAFADVLAGDDGANRLEGAAGSDVLYGGAGADSFVFGTAGGMDYVGDFVKVQGDKVWLRSDVNGSGITTQEQALAHAMDVAGNTWVDIGGGSGITLIGVSVAGLVAGDFVIF